MFQRVGCDLGAIMGRARERAEGHVDGEIISTCRDCGEPERVWRWVESFGCVMPCSEACGCCPRPPRREQAIERKLNRAGVPMRFRDAESSFDADGESLYIYGPVRTGKTTAACKMARKWLEAGKSVKFAVTADIAAHELGDRDGGIAYMESLLAPDVLILDDLGKGETSPWAVSLLFTVINARYNDGKAITATSNHSTRELARALARAADAHTAEAVARRIEDMTQACRFGQGVLYGK